MFKKILKIAGIVLGAVVLLIVGFLIYTKIQINRGDLIKWGGQWYTKEQLEKKIPPQYIEAPAKNTPEEVYVKFREALLKDDIETALGLITGSNREKYKEAFKDEEKLEEWVRKLPKGITREDSYGNFAYYNIDMGTENKNTISFIKNEYGYWEIDSI